MSLLRAASLIALLSLISKVVGLFRDQIIAYYCGLSAVTDAYQVASLIPIQFALIMLGGLNGPFHSAVVSTLTRFFKEDQPKVYGRVLTSAMLLSVVSTSILATVLFVFAPQIMGLWGNMPAETVALAVIQMRIMAPAFVVSGLIGIFYGILSIKNTFITPSLSPIMASVGVIVSLALFSSPDPESLSRALAWGTLLGAILQLLLQLLPLIGFFKTMHVEVRLRDPELQNFLSLLLPAMLSSTIGQVNVFIIQFFAGGLQEGSISAFRFGNLLIQLPLGILLTALLVPLLPLLSAAVTPGKGFEALKDRLNQGLRPVIMLTIPITVLLICFGHFAIVLLFERGEFNAADSWLTYKVLVFLSLSVTVYAIRDLLIRVFYALGDSKTPFLSSFITIGAMFLGSWLLAPSMGVGGVALASSAAAGLNFLVLYALLRKRIGPLMSDLSMIHLLKVSGAAVPMALLGGYSFFMLEALLLQDKWQAIIQAITYSALLSGLYVLLLYVFKDKEILHLSDTLLRRIKR
jgi:putative peptidoglycan lipid II flippase